MEKVFEPDTENSKQNQILTKLAAEKQIHMLRDSTQAKTQAIQDQTKSIQEKKLTSQ